MLKQRVVCVALFGILLCTVDQVVAQQARQDSARGSTAALRTQKADTSKAQPVSEFELGEIVIEAIIERPNVDIFPKRVKVDVEEIAFIDRSFEPEIKEVPKNLLLYDEELDTAKKLTRLKAILEKKRKELKK